MSKWRRIALENVPSCKHIIEEAANPTAMWSDLFRELTSRRDDEALNLAKNQQICRFAMHCLRYADHPPLTNPVEYFFANLLNLHTHDELLQYYPAHDITTIRGFYPYDYYWA